MSMTQTTTEQRPRLWPEPWAAQAFVQANSIEHQMRVAAAAAPLDARRQAAVEAVERLVAAARHALQPRSWWPWRGPFDRWRGTSVELAYQSLHAAKVFLVDLLPREDVDALTPAVLARVAMSLPPDDLRRLNIDTLETAPPTEKRAGVKQAMQLAYDASDQLHARVRGFRNVLLSAAVLIAVFMGILVAVVSRYPDALPLCFTPSVTSVQIAPETHPRKVCPSGEDPPGLAAPANGQQPEPGDMSIVAGLGLLGGGLAAAFAIRKIRGSSTPYDVPTAVALLKVPTGALTAVAGILLLGGGFVPGLSELDTQRQILAYALVFGYAQQLATRFIDDRAQSILNSVPSTDPEAKRPAPSPRQPAPPSSERWMTWPNQPLDCDAYSRPGSAGDPFTW